MDNIKITAFQNQGGQNCLQFGDDDDNHQWLFKRVTKVQKWICKQDFKQLSELKQALKAAVFTCVSIRPLEFEKFDVAIQETYNQWELAVNGPWGSLKPWSRLTPNKTETPLITQSRHYNTLTTLAPCQTVEQSSLLPKLGCYGSERKSIIKTKSRGT